MRPNTFARVSDHFSDGAQLLEAARAQGLEGIMAKIATSKYESKRSSCWVKIKIVTQQEFIICGYTSGERDHFGSLALGVYEDGKLEYCGNVGSGFNNTSLSALGKKLEKLEVAKSPFSPAPKIPGKTTWVKPELVCEVKFNHWTRDHRLRAPVFLGMRDDISAKEVVREVDGTEVSDSEASAAQPAARPKLLSADKAEVILNVDGKPLKFTNLNKVFYPREKYTKRDVLNYYDAVADLILPYLKDRPLSLKRYPNVIDSEFFFQKDAAKSFPDWLRTEKIQSEEKFINYVICNDRATLLYLANLACIDQNPWMSRVGSLENPDFMLIDLDPYHCEYDRIVEAAQLVREKLTMMGLQAFPKTTGGDGMHLYVPLEPVYTYDQVRSFAEIIARMVAGERPDLFTTPRTVAKREKGKVYYDYMQVREGSTISAPYVLRAYPGAPVSTPLRWSEVTRGLSSQQFDIRNAPDRFARLGDLFAPVLTLKQRLEDAIGMIEKMVVNSSKK
jgi:bifunctional non-homologous end joining protein LigD